MWHCVLCCVHACQVSKPAALRKLDPPLDLRFGVRRQPDYEAYDPQDPFETTRSEQLLAGAANGGKRFTLDGDGTEWLDHSARRFTFFVFAAIFGVACQGPHSAIRPYPSSLRPRVRGAR